MEEGQFVAFAAEICDSGSSYNNCPAKLNRGSEIRKSAPTVRASIGAPQQWAAAPAEVPNRKLLGEPPKVFVSRRGEEPYRSNVR
jgi:hypothetical protein